MYRIFVFLMIIILSASFPAYTLVRQDKEFKVFQFPPDMIPRIDGNPADWNIVPDHYAVGVDELRNMTNDNPINGHLPFERKSFYGLEVQWYAVDKQGSIAQFTTGYGPIPSAVFEDQDRYDRIFDYFADQPASCGSALSEVSSREQAKGIANYDMHLKEAQQGLFIYDEDEYGPIHCLHAIPETPLTINHAPEWVAEYLSQFVLRNIVFSQAQRIDVEKVFECDK